MNELKYFIQENKEKMEWFWQFNILYILLYIGMESVQLSLNARHFNPNIKLVMDSRESTFLFLIFEVLSMHIYK